MRKFKVISKKNKFFGRIGVLSSEKGNDLIIKFEADDIFLFPAKIIFEKNEVEELFD